MANKAFLKVIILISIITLIYICFITFVVSPKITTYLTTSEMKQATAQLKRVSSVISSKEEQIKKQKQIKVLEYKKNIKDISHVAYSFMKSNYELFKKGLITKDEALKNSIAAISNIIYGFEDDYIYILDKKGNLVYHPNKAYNGKNVYLEADVNGKLFIPELINKSVKNGFTYTKYSWVKLNSKFISDKIVYSLYFEPFDLIINAGVYVKSIEEELEKDKNLMLRDLYPLIESIVFADKGYIFVMDENNKMLLHPNKQLINKDIFNFNQEDSKQYSIEELKQAYKNNKPWKYKWNASNDLENYKYEKISWVDYNEFFKWYIVSSVYKDDLENSAKQINKIIINSSLVFLFLLIFLAVFFIRKFLQPISIMALNAKLVEAGNFTVRNNIKRDDELGILAKQFDSMLDFIENNTKILKQKVEDRTKLLKNQLYYDELTGLRNREALINDLKKESLHSLILLNIDSFDELNEIYGYEITNELLIVIANSLNEFCEKENVCLYKLEANLFAILDINLNRLISYESFFNKINEVFKQDFYLNKYDLNLNIDITLGCSISNEEPIISANIALNKAKHLRLKYLVFNNTINTKEKNKNSLETKKLIEKAIEEDRIVPFHQGIFDKNKKLIKYETLMRILLEENGKEEYISPAKFYDVAFKTNQYFRLGQRVIEKTLSKIEQIEVQVSINISFSDIMNVQFNEILRELVTSLDKKDKEKIVFEILESDFIEDFKVVEDFISFYRVHGIKIAIDDFGTGFSNFSHILAIHPEYIKIDGSLIKNINKDEKSYEMVKSIVAFSKELGIKVIAEYIHCKEVYEIVVALGVDEFQGFYLGEPKLLIK